VAENKPKRHEMEILNRLLEQIRDVRLERAVYIDETGIDTFLLREHAYSKRGEKVIG
jgi:hypothetical protein